MIEADETYFLHSRKGDKNLVRKARKTGGAAPVPGLSVFQDCVLTAQERQGNRYASWIGQGKPKHKDVKDSLERHTSGEGQQPYAATASPPTRPSARPWVSSITDVTTGNRPTLPTPLSATSTTFTVC